ncbi:Sds3-like-domain-containing protein [Sporodiniella umbellata]|nr:Sds3-like-domain-containing protein [Sporodiniella umbellata]
MLETNKPFMFGSSTTAPKSNTNSPNHAASELPSPKSVLTGPVHGYYYKQEDKEGYQGQPARLNSAFSHPEEYAYKPNSSSSSSHGPNYTQLLPMTHHYSPPPPPPMLKQAKESFIHSIKSDYSTFDETESWFDGPYEGDFGDNRKVKRRKEMTLKMERLNVEFLEKKNRLYDEKLLAINKELKEARKDTHTTYLDGLRDLENMRQKMIDDGQLFREYQKQITDHQFELEIYQAEEEYLLETHEVREKMFNVLEEKRRKLKEDKDNYDLAYDLILDTQSRLNRRNLRKRGADTMESKANKKKQMNGPALVFKLKENDLNSDMQQIRNAIQSPTPSSPKRHSALHNKKKSNDTL